MISFIVSAYDRSDCLRCCLASLALQTKPYEILIACNSDTHEMYAAHLELAKYFEVMLFPTTGGCYDASNEIAEHYAEGDWLAFPSDDSYYVPRFSEIMLATAEAAGWDFVYCDMVYDRHPEGLYRVMNAQPRTCAIDKTNFLVKRAVFKGFPPHESDWRDGALAEQLVAEGVRHGKAPGVLVVHN
jgi:glycosyltransferase involved in cell wall biosynthesis